MSNSSWYENPEHPPPRTPIRRKFVFGSSPRDTISPLIFFKAVSVTSIAIAVSPLCFVFGNLLSELPKNRNNSRDHHKNYGAYENEFYGEYRHSFFSGRSVFFFKSAETKTAIATVTITATAPMTVRGSSARLLTKEISVWSMCGSSRFVKKLICLC